MIYGESKNNMKTGGTLLKFMFYHQTIKECIKKYLFVLNERFDSIFNYKTHNIYTSIINHTYFIQLLPEKGGVRHI